ncbi:MAG: DUF4143 domain-containing protein [archaeon]|nr:DUF4143 domain-containing protein [archaeon]
MVSRPKEYVPRLADKRLNFLLSSCGAVYVKGPKWCGKSTTAEQQAKSTVYMQDKEKQAQYVALARNAPHIFLSGETPRLIDEWQSISFIWDSIRFEVDQRNEFGQFILTGSTVPNLDEKKEYEHSGAGRIVPMILRTMSLYESRDSNGKVSLSNLFQGIAFEGAAESNQDLADYAYLICRGGWPLAVIQMNDRVALQQVRNYYQVLIQEDFQRLKKKKRGTLKINSLLKSYSRNVSSQCSISTLRNDLRNHGDSDMDDDTIYAYLEDLESLYVIEELPAWNVNIRSKAAVHSADTRHFIDPSIGCAALDVWPEDLINDLNTMGCFFESLVVRDLRVYAEALGGTLYHYRDSDGLEADAVIKLENGKWAAIEVKLCDQARIDEGAAHLIALRDKVESKYIGEPEFLMVVTATTMAYRRADGVYVVPLGCLGP